LTEIDNIRWLIKANPGVKDMPRPRIEPWTSKFSASCKDLIFICLQNSFRGNNWSETIFFLVATDLILEVFFTVLSSFLCQNQFKSTLVKIVDHNPPTHINYKSFMKVRVLDFAWSVSCPFKIKFVFWKLLILSITTIKCKF